MTRVRDDRARADRCTRGAVTASPWSGVGLFVQTSLILRVPPNRGRLPGERHADQPARRAAAHTRAARDGTPGDRPDSAAP
jgi:hypothetical protein